MSSNSFLQYVIDPSNQNFSPPREKRSYYFVLMKKLVKVKLEAHTSAAESQRKIGTFLVDTCLFIKRF
jgi:hypothetical protein